MAEATPSRRALQHLRAVRRLDAVLASFDVPTWIARLRASRAYESESHAGRTLVKRPDLRIVLEAMKPMARLSFHGTSEQTTFQILVGRLRVWVARGECFDLAEGSFTAFDAAQVHEIDCLEECAFVVTLAWPPAARGRDSRDGAG